MKRLSLSVALLAGASWACGEDGSTQGSSVGNPASSGGTASSSDTSDGSGSGGATTSSDPSSDPSTGDSASSTTGSDVDPPIGPADFIRSAPYSRLVLEVDAARGWAPRAEAMTEIPAALAAILDKPDGVEAILDQTLDPVGSDHGWTFSELNALAEATLDLEVDADTVKMHVLFLDGYYVGDDPDAVILGLAWGRTKLAVFGQTIATSCQGQVGAGLEERLCAGTERSVWVHEIGHLLGLVDNGTPMITEREDPDHPHHDLNEECVMYWAAERQNAVQHLASRLTDSDIAYLDFDDACLADLAAVRDGG